MSTVNRREIHVVRHQTVRPQRQPIPPRILIGVAQIRLAAAVCLEHGGPTVSLLRHLVREPRNNDACYTAYASSITQTDRKAKITRMPPILLFCYFTFILPC